MPRKCGHRDTIHPMSWNTELLPDPLPDNPLITAARWLEEGWQARHEPNPNAMALATVNAAGAPSVRIVLCKDIVPEPGYLMFYTNYHSRKGEELAGNSHAAVVLHWDHQHRQLRVEGTVTRTSEAESDAYFATRTQASAVGAWASEQSRPIASRTLLEQAVARERARLNPQGSPTAVIPRPPHWGGYRLWAEAVELWVEGASRIHDRARWTRPLGAASAGGFSPGPWRATRLQP